MLRRGQSALLIYIKSTQIGIRLSEISLSRPSQPWKDKRVALGSYAGRMRTLCFALLAAALLVACDREGPLERAGEKVDRAVERAGDKIENATDRK
jgi:hypothetical protein